VGVVHQIQLAEAAPQNPLAVGVHQKEVVRQSLLPEVPVGTLHRTLQQTLPEVVRLLIRTLK